MKTLRPLRVLIVEDEGLIAMDIEDTVIALGHTVAGWCLDAKNAIDRFTETCPDLTLLDVELARGTSGIAVAQHLKAVHGHFLFLTANPDKLDSGLNGAVGVLPKPFTTANLRATLQYIHEGVLDPPPASPMPGEMRIGEAYRDVWGIG